MDTTPLASEAELIALLRPLTVGAPGAFGLRDDCAQLTPRPGFDLVLKTDPIRGGVHFFADDPPASIAAKALAVNVSDLAAKGAKPIAYLMALSFPEAPSRGWLQQFAGGLQLAQTLYNCHLIGGDTDRAPGPLSVAITVIGEVPEGRMVRRDTARAGDAIYLSGTIGVAGLGLQLRAEQRDGRDDLARRWGLSEGHRIALIKRYLQPEPRLGLADAVRAYASAAMDVSDGLVKDLERMCLAPGVGATVDATAIRFSTAGDAIVVKYPEMLATLITAGDDYEILAAVPPSQTAAFEAAAAASVMSIARIGTFTAEPGVTVRRADGSAMTFDRKGWDHF